MRALWALPATVAAASGCALQPTEMATPFESLGGRYSNEAQYQAAPAEIRRPPAAGYPYDWIDLQTAVFSPVEAPAIEGRTFYLEWRSGGPDGPISRQRIWTFTHQADTGWRMAFHTMRDPARFAGKAAIGGAFLTLGPSDLIAYPQGCDVVFRQTGPAEWRGDINPQTCLITAQSGRRMRITAAITIQPDRVRYEEAGRLESGAYAFRAPGGSAYLFDRLR